MRTEVDAVRRGRAADSKRAFGPDAVRYEAGTTAESCRVSQRISTSLSRDILVAWIARHADPQIPLRPGFVEFDDGVLFMIARFDGRSRHDAGAGCDQSGDRAIPGNLDANVQASAERRGVIHQERMQCRARNVLYARVNRRAASNPSASSTATYAATLAHAPCCQNDPPTEPSTLDPR